VWAIGQSVGTISQKGTIMVTLKSPADIPAVVDAMLGFTPSNSLVVLGLGGGPSARVDITSGETLIAAVESLTTAAQHWGKGTIVALYSDDVDMVDLEYAMATLLPDVPVAIMVEVTTMYGPTHVIDTDGNLFVATPPQDPEMAAKRVVSSRDALVEEAEQTTSADEAWMMAREAYRAGDGARSWIYLDRFHALGGSRTPDSMILERFLTQAINPRSEMAQAFFLNA
jgi:hypothetical protein